MFSEEERVNYRNETKKVFSKILRQVFSEKEEIVCITDKNKIKQYLIKLNEAIKEEVTALGHIWWWRGCCNNSLERFKNEEGYLYINYKCMKIKGIYVYKSPITNFDLILLSIEGEEKNQVKLDDYIWDNNKFSPVNIDKNRIVITKHQYMDNEEILHYKLPYNIVLTAKFGILNTRLISSDALEINLNKFLLNQIKFEEFIEWYTTLLRKLKSRFDRFHEYLIEYPMLGLQDKLGKNIYDKLHRLEAVDIKDKVFYRARNLSNDEPYSKEKMWNPDSYKYKVTEGRYNHNGKSFLYVASNESTAFKEVSKEEDNSCCMVKIHIKQLKNILDLRKINFYDANKSMDYILLHYALVYEGTLSQVCENQNIKNEYVVSRFLSDCARMKGYNGIIFNSTKEEDGENLVIFRPDDFKKIKWIEMKDESYIYRIK